MDARVRAALLYAVVLSALLAFSVVASLAGAAGLGIAAYTIPVAIYTARGGFGRATGLVATAALSGLLVAGTAGAACAFGLGASVGLIAGLGVAKRWRYGWIVTAVTGLGCVLAGYSVFSAWDVWQAQKDRVFDWVLQSIDPPGAGPLSEGMAAQYDAILQLKTNWPAIGLGVQFAHLLIAACVVVSFVSGWVRRRHAEPGPRGSFQTMRPPEWLVWVAIATAGLWWADRHWPGTVLREVSWNTAIGLAVVYWLNGLSIAVYAFTTLQAQVMTCATVLAVLLLLGALQPMVTYFICSIGLFDTWGNFRRRIDAVAAAAASTDNDNGGEGP